MLYNLVLLGRSSPLGERHGLAMTSVSVISFVCFNYGKFLSHAAALGIMTKFARLLAFAKTAQQWSRQNHNPSPVI
jgi:hypothetical protein